MQCGFIVGHIGVRVVLSGSCSERRAFGISGWCGGVFWGAGVPRSILEWLVLRLQEAWLVAVSCDRLVARESGGGLVVVDEPLAGARGLVCPSDVGGVSVSGLEERLFSVAEQSCVGAVSCAAFMVRSGSRLFYDDMVRQLGGSSSGMDAWGRYCFSLECVQAGFTGIPLEFRQRLWGAFAVGLQGEFVFVDG